MIRGFRTLAVGVAALALAACNPMEELGDADTEVAQFHNHFDASNFEAIWNGSNDLLKSSGTREDFDAMMGGLRQYWGEVKSTERESFGLNTNNGVTTVRVTHNTVFETGPAVETFNFVRKGEELQLMGYNIKTPEKHAAEKAAEDAAEDEK